MTSNSSSSTVSCSRVISTSLRSAHEFPLVSDTLHPHASVLDPKPVGGELLFDFLAPPFHLVHLVPFRQHHRPLLLDNGPDLACSLHQLVELDRQAAEGRVETLQLIEQVGRTIRHHCLLAMREWARTWRPFGRGRAAAIVDGPTRTRTWDQPVMSRPL